MRKSQIAALACVCLLYSCKVFQSEDRRGTPFISVDGTDIYDDEFIYVFNKNNFMDSAVAISELEEYLDLFINFKLKISEARSLGLQNTNEFSQEFESYREELIKPYLTERDVNDRLVRQAYERLKTEINASHILIQLNENASPGDTLRAYEKISSIRDRVNAGEDFNTLAGELSEDPSAAMNRGQLGYFTALQMVFPFEEMAYATNAGEISPVFRTSFGYHILKVHDKRPSAGKIKVSHIMIRSPKGMPAEDSIAAARKVWQIHSELEKGGLWFDLCGQFSEDLSSRSNGGALPWFGAGNMAPGFEEAAFAIDSLGSYSEPARSAYGWHIIRLDDRKGLEPFEEIRENLQNRVKRDSRSELSRKALIARLKEENRFREDRSALEEMFSSADTSLTTGTWNYKPAGDGEIFSINDSSFAMTGFIDFVKLRSSPDQTSPEQRLRNLYQEYVDQEVIQYEKGHLAEKNYDYKMLLKEYEEGILLFQLMDDKIWSKAVEDTAGLRTFYQNNREQYKYGERVKAAVFNASSRKIRDELRPMLEQKYIPLRVAPVVIDFTVGNQLSEKSKHRLDSAIQSLLVNEEWAVELSGQENAIQQDIVNSYFTSAGIHSSRILSGNQEGVSGPMTIRLVSNSRKIFEEYFNENSALNLGVEEGIFELGELPGNIKWGEGLYEVDSAGRFYMVEVKEALPSGYKTLDEIRGIVISDYQNFLEKNWITELKAKYPVTINETRRKKLFKKLVEI